MVDEQPTSDKVGEQPIGNLHISRILEARALEEVMVDHGGVGRNLGPPCKQPFNLDRALSTQPHTSVIQVTTAPEVPPTRARKDV